MKPILIFVFLLFLLTINVNANNIGTVKSLEGNPVIIRKGLSIVKKEIPVFVGDTLKTIEKQKASVKLNERAEFKVAPSTIVKFKKNFVFIKRGKTVFHVFKQTKKFRVYTHSATIGVYGTRFSVDVDDSGNTEVELFNGSVTVTALKGKKEVVQMKPGQKIKVSKIGVLKFQTAAKKKTDSENVNIEDDYLTEPESLDLETSGNLLYSVFPVRGEIDKPLKTAYRLLINGCESLNGMELLSTSGSPIRLSALDKESYEMTLIINGVPYNWNADLTNISNGIMKKIKYKRFRIVVNIGNLKGLRLQNELSNIKINVNYSEIDTEMAVVYDLDRKRNENIVIFEGTISDGGDLLYYFPEEYDNPPMLKLEYFGKAEVEKKKIKLQLLSNQNEYNIKF